MPDVISLQKLDPAGVKIESVPETISLAELKPGEFKIESAPKKMAWEKAGLHGLGQGATFGFSDELVGVGGAITGKGYTKARDEYRATLAQAEKDQPLAFRSGDVGGSIATSLLPGVGIARGAKLLSSLGKAAALGAASGAGYSSADLTKGPSEVSNLAGDIGKGAGIGAVAQGVFGKLGSAVSKTPDAIRQTANERAVKAATGSSVSSIRKIAGVSGNAPGDIQKIEKQIGKVGKELLDSGAVKFWDKVEDIAPKLAGKTKEAGEKIGAIANKIDEIAPKSISGKKIADEMVEYASKIPNTASGEALQNKILAEAASIEKMGDIGFKEAQAIKNQYKFKPGSRDSYIDNQDVSNALKNIVGKNMADTAESLSSLADRETKALLDQYKTAKTQYGAFKSTSDASSGRVMQNLANRFVSPSDYGVGAAATMASGALNPLSVAKGIAASAVNNQLRQRGSSAAAVTLNSIANKMEKSPAWAKQYAGYFVDALKQGPASIITVHQSLMQYPDYRKEFDSGLKLPKQQGLSLPQGRK